MLLVVTIDSKLMLVDLLQYYYLNSFDETLLPMIYIPHPIDKHPTVLDSSRENLPSMSMIVLLIFVPHLSSFLSTSMAVVVVVVVVAFVPHVPDSFLFVVD